LRRLRFPFSPGTAAAVLGIWTLVGLFRGADRYFSDPFHRHRLEFGLSEALAQCLLSAYLWAALTPAVVVLAKRCMPSRRRWAVPSGALLVAGAAAPLVHGTGFELAYPFLMGFPCVVETQMGALRESLSYSYLTEFATFWAIVGATWTLTYAHLSRERAIRASQLATRLARARLEALKTQLHPHFLFNALHSVLPLVFRDADAASRTVRRLSDLLRLSLRNEAYDLLPLAREIEILAVYLEIQKTRFADRLTVALDVPEGLGDALVPTLILQPLVENAIKHGIAVRPGAGRVEVRARRERDGRLSLVVADDGPGPSGAERPDGGGGVGLRNTRERLGLLYGENHEFAFEGAPGHGCRVRLSIPYVAGDPSTRPGSLPEGVTVATGALPVVIA
jgi:two-component system, LytTR family, sensor kinase